MPILLSGDDDVGAPGQGAEFERQRVPGLAAHDHRAAQRGALEVGQVFGQVPGELAARTNDAVGGAGINQVQAGQGGWSGWGGRVAHGGFGHTATGALMAGWHS